MDSSLCHRGSAGMTAKIMIKILLILLFMIALTDFTSAQKLWAVATEPCPVLNSPDFNAVFGGKNGTTVKTDGSGLIREMEFIALPGTVFELLGEYAYDDHKVYNVKCDEYEYNSLLFIDSRFVELKTDKPKAREKRLPTKDEIYKFLDNAVGEKYCWGGDYIGGIDKLLEYYKPSGEISDDLKYKWTLRGCDCSGLMYQATNGYTERNTSKLVTFGEGVEIEGLSAEEIAAKVKPFDMMVWNGHVIYVYDEKTSIQSGLSKGGVVKLDLIETLKHLVNTKTPVNDYNSASGDRFVVRRWYSDK